MSLLKSSNSSLWHAVPGIVVPGHRVASGLAENSPYPEGTIAMQMTIFQDLGLDLSGLFLGTINISIQPYQFKIVNPDITLRQVTWTTLHPPEDFSFVTCQLTVGETTRKGWVYSPHPETKARHFQENSVIEVMAPPMTDLAYNCPVTLAFKATAISIYPAKGPISPSRGTN